MRFGSYRAFCPNARCSRLFTVPETSNTHTVKTVLKRAVWFSSYRARARALCLAAVPETRKHTHNQIWRPHSIPTSLVVSGSNLETSLRSYVTGRFRIKSGNLNSVYYVTGRFRIKTVLKRPVRLGSYRAFGPNARYHSGDKQQAHN